MAKPTLTKEDDIRTRLQSFDRAWYDQIYRQTCYAFGEPWTKWRGAPNSGDGDLPVYPDIVVRQLGIGQSRRILNNSILTLSRVLSSEPMPEFPQVDRITSELRKGFFLRRWHGEGYGVDGHWAREVEGAFLDGDQLGTGVLQIGLRTNPKTGKQKVHLRHVPLTQTLWDRHERSIGRARWIAFVHYLAPEDAAAMYGDEVLKFKQELYESSTSERFEFVRITEYFDIGWGNGEGKPTYAVFVGPWCEPAKVRQENTFGCLPVAYYEYICAPGMRRPIGKVVLQMGTAEAINEVERHLRKAVRDGIGFDIVDAQQLDGNDLKRLERGDLNVKVKIINPSTTGAPPYTRVPNLEVGQSILALLNLYERQYNSDSATTELDRGSYAGPVRSATEAAALDSKSQQQSVLTRRATLFLYQRVVEKTLAVAAVGDRDEVVVDVDGFNVVVNSTSDPRMRIDRILEEPSMVLIDQQSVEQGDEDRERMRRFQELQMVAPLLQMGVIDPRWFAEQALKAIGEKDPTVAMVQPQQAAAMQMMQGQPAPSQNPTPDAATQTLTG